jgi:hypothetical protein
MNAKRLWIALNQRFRVVAASRNEGKERGSAIVGMYLGFSASLGLFTPAIGSPLHSPSETKAEDSLK